MMNNGRRTIGGILALAVMAIVVMAGVAVAEEYVSWRGGFHITVPDNFGQLDYRVVDGFLRANKADQSVLDYEVVFSDTTGAPFPMGEYFLVAIEKGVEPNERQIDSVLTMIFGSFGRRMRYAPVTDFVTNLKSNTPSYSRDDKVASVIADVVQPDGSAKRHLMMIKIYDQGIVSLFYYAPDSLFEAGVEKMKDVMGSFSTEDLDAAAARDKPKITSARPSEKPERQSKDKPSIPIAVYIGVGVVLMIVLIRRRKKSKK
jgi:hypothetical protein